MNLVGLVEFLCLGLVEFFCVSGEVVSGVLVSGVLVLANISSHKDVSLLYVCPSGQVILVLFDSQDEVSRLKT